MPYTKRWTSIKMGAVVPGAAGPQTFPANTAWVSSPVPCRGAKAVVFTLRSTDTNAPASTGIQLTNDPAGAGPLNAAAQNYNVRGGGANRMDRPGGLTTMLVHQDVSGVCFHGFAQLLITSNAGAAHTAFDVDVEVFYGTGDAEAMRADTQQFTTNPV